MLDKFERVLECQERKKLHCTSCKRSTIHTLEARCSAAWCDKPDQRSGGQEYSIFRCGACDEVCYETASWDDFDIEIDYDTEAPYTPIYYKQFPTPASSHFNFNTESTPYRLNQVLDEMLYALAGQKMMLATIGLRLAVEFIVNDKQCEGHNLYHKIESLCNLGHVDIDQKELLQRIREMGNEGAHEAKGMTAKEMVAGFAIIEGLLEKLYNGPARHTATIKKAKALFTKDDTPSVNNN